MTLPQVTKLTSHDSTEIDFKGLKFYFDWSILILYGWPYCGLSPHL